MSEASEPGLPGTPGAESYTPAARLCECPDPPLKGYLLAAFVGALSLVVIVAGLMVGWNLGQRGGEPVTRPGGSPGLPVAAGEDSVVEPLPGGVWNPLSPFSGGEAGEAVISSSVQGGIQGIEAGQRASPQDE